MASAAPKMVFIKGFILKGTRPAHAELELSAAAVVNVVVDGDAVVQPQRAEMRDVQPDAESPVVAVTAGEGISGGVHRADVVEQGKAQAHAPVFFKDGNAVFQRAKPGGVAADGFR